MMELFILIGGAYALYTAGMAIASELDYRAVQKKKVMCQPTNRLLFVYSKSPIDYYKRVEKGRKEGDTESVGQLQLSPTAESGDPPRELPRGN